MPPLTISVKHSVGIPSHSNQNSIRNKRHPFRMKDKKQSLFAEDTILYVENLNISTKKND